MVLNVLVNLNQEWKHGVNTVLLVVKTDLIVLPTILTVIGVQVLTSLIANAHQMKEWKLGRNIVRSDVTMNNTVLPTDTTVAGLTMIQLTISIVSVKLEKEVNHGENSVLLDVKMPHTVLDMMFTVNGTERYQLLQEVTKNLKNQHVNLVFKLMISASLLMTFQLFLHQKTLKL